jgi:hypothetical protein
MGGTKDKIGNYWVFDQEKKIDNLKKLYLSDWELRNILLIF